MGEIAPNLVWVQKKKILYFRYPRLSLNRNLVHGVFTRHGGLSDPPYESLNTSYTVGDRPEKVTGNLTRIKEVIGAHRLIFMNQSHGDHILLLRKGLHIPCGEIPSADAVITDIPGLAAMVNQADCQAVILFDPTRRVVANVHCGWRGHVQNILKRTVIRMTDTFGCKASDLLAAIGPSLGPCCAEFVSYKEIFPATFQAFMVRENHFDLWSTSRRQLERAGLRKENIEIAGICSRCCTDLFYSYRREGRTGRFGTIVMLR
jgi:YfiH family protein